MASADRLAAQAGVPVYDLMEAAGKAVARELLSRFPQVKRALVLCGKGNNGGDGYVAARELARRLRVTLLELSASPSTEEAARARQAYVSRCDPPARLSAEAVHAWLTDVPEDAGVVVDALLGSGLTRPPDGELASVIKAVNEGSMPVVAVDVPTGIDADRAFAPGPHVRADVTVQLAGAKVASLLHPARTAFLGARQGVPAEVVVADIGVPSQVLEDVSQTLYLDAAGVSAWLPVRGHDAHKYEAGTVTVVAGSPRYLGAAELVCRGAWRAGAGLVTLIATERYPGAWPETVLATPDEGGRWPPAVLSEKAAGALVVGPGLEASEPGSPLGHLQEIIRWAPGPVVLDAGALAPHVLLPALEASPADRQPIVITPHRGEAARLLDAVGSGVDVQNDPLEAARSLTAGTGTMTVLKGATTVVVSPDGREALSDRGHPGLASGGTGDVLAGALGALLAAPGGDPFERTCLAVFAHGRAGQLAAETKGFGLVASDVAESLPRAMLAIAEARPR